MGFPERADVFSEGAKALDEALAALGRGDHRLAAAAAGRAVAARPKDPTGWDALAVACHGLGEFAGAIDAGRRLVALQPDSAAGFANLGVALRAVGEAEAAEAAYRRAIACDPGFAAAHANLANLLRDQGRLDEAEASLRAAVAARPAFVEAWRGMAAVLQGQGRLAEAVAVLQQATAAAPDSADLLSDLGACLTGLQRFDEGRDALMRAIRLAPGSAAAHGNLGALLLRAGRLIEAEQATARARALDPEQHRWLGNLAVICKDLGRWDEAEAHYRAALELKPDYATGHGNFLFCLNYHPDKPAAEIFAEYRLWDELHARPLAPEAPRWANGLDPDRRLRVGYVSPDFREHSARHFIEPMLQAHDRTEVEIFCYAELAAPDQATERFQALADVWRPTAGLDDAALAALIARDRIDILVDLGGHTASSRLRVFARRPAPIQLAHFLGHGYTSGLSAMDGFLGDARLTPEGCEDLFAEPLIRLPRIPIAYAPDPAMPAPTASPALRNGYTTFGYFGRPERVNDRVMAAWAEILKRAPGARLRLNSRPYADPAYRALTFERFAAHGVEPEQLELVFTTPQSATWAAYGEIDIALDPFPHNAGTTTIEALWMGVPVLSLKDRPSVGRFGAAILGALELDTWVAEDVDAYIATGVAAALYPEGPAVLRAGLRHRFRASPLFDAPGLARALETAYRGLWRDWSATAPAPLEGEPGPVEAAPTDTAPTDTAPTDTAPKDLGAQAQQLHALFAAGDLDGAEALAHTLIKLDDASAEPRHVLGLIAFRRGDLDTAQAEIEASLALGPQAAAWSNLGAVRRAAGRLDLAEAACREAVALDPALADAQRNLVNVLLAAGRHAAAAEALAAAAEHLAQPKESLERLGDVLTHLGRAEDAAGAYGRAVASGPASPALVRKFAGALDGARRLDEAARALTAILARDAAAADVWVELSDLQRRLGRLDEAEASARRALALDPALAMAANTLGTALTARGQWIEAQAAFDQAIALDPAFAEAFNNRALALAKHGKATAAERDLREALRLRPERPEIGFNLAAALQDQGRLAEALDVYRETLRQRPDHPTGHGSALFCLSYQPDLSAEAIYAEFRAWEARHAARFFPAQPPAPTDDATGRRLRLGYVSPDFCAKSAAYFIEPLLAAHDRADVEIFCYAEVVRPDATTERMQALADHWRPTVGLSDDALADLIRQDRIDVLVDLAGHTANNRLLALARKPAPVQIAHFLGHGYTSGLKAMDVFLADAALAPPGADALFAESLERLPRIPLAYQPPAGMPEPSDLPALRKGHITFGHFGRSVRLNDKVVAAWAEILKRVPGSRLMLNAAPFSYPGVCDRYGSLFEALGVARDRLDMVFTAPQSKTFEAYGEIDIALDPFPHNAGTTTIEALWLGVPVLSLADRPSVGRFGASILGAVGLGDWVATSVEDYVARAVQAAANPAYLAKLRAGLRARVQASPICDAAGLARTLEATYRRLLAERCRTPALVQPQPQPQPQPKAPPPDDPEVARLKQLFLTGDLEGARSLARQRLGRAPEDADAHHILGLIAYRLTDYAQAERRIRKSLAARPDPAAWSNLGAALRAVGDLPGAEAAYRSALALDPGLGDARANLANLLLDQRRAADAEGLLRQVVAAGGASANAYLSLGNALYHQGKLVQAADVFRQTMAMAPDAYDACRNLGSTLAGLGRYEEAEALHRRALEIQPDYAAGHSSLLFNLNYRPDLTAEQIFAEYRRWDERHAAPLKAGWRPHDNGPDPERRLKVGYVSPDFRDHAVALFAAPLLEAHDRRRVELFCYSEAPAQDAVTERFRAAADHWIGTVGLSDAALAERIRADGIDVLVDLAGHSSGNRLLTFALKPAPVQVSYLVGHGYTTGLEAIDAFLADPALAPPGADALFSERLVRLNRAPLVYEPPAAMPAVGPLPARRNGYVTFGHFGRSVRVNDRVIAAWAEILKRVPGSRLMLNNAPFADPDVAALIAARFAARGVARDRLELIYTSPQTKTWATYGEVDIALDPFPHNAGTTTIEALWMGVPVVSLADRPSVGRFGAMILGAVGLSDWVAEDVESYVANAVTAAGDLDALADLRKTLRGRFEASPLRDAKGLAVAIEDAYRDLWRDWCRSRPGGEARPAAKVSAPGKPEPRAVPSAPPARDLVADLERELIQAMAAFNTGDLAGAARGVEPALAADPDNVRALHLRGLIAYREGRLEDAARDVGRAVERSPELAEPRWNLTAILRSLGRLDEACAMGREAVRLAPNAAAAHNNLGAALRDLGWALEAETSFHRALTLDPRAVDAWSNLSWLLAMSGRAREGEAAARKALALNARDGNAWNSLGSAFLYQDRLDEAAGAFRKAVEAKPDLHVAHSNLLFCLNYRPDLSAEAIFAEYQAWNARHAAPLAPAQRPTPRARQAGERIRVGYVSADFRHHAASFFVEPMLAAHDRSRVELFGYAEVAKPDAVTARLRRLTDHWRSTMGMSDEALAQAIREDGIDVLVDLGGHTAGNRLLTFARRPAPVQIAHMVGSGQTTGLTAMDAFLCDARLCPEGADAVFSERLARLTRLPLCYRPPEGMPAVSPSPVERRGFVTFGSFSRTARINDAVLDAWAAILHGAPASRLILNSKPFQDEAARADFQARFARRGVTADRLDLVYTSPQSKTWAAYGEVDIALDPFPHNAGTTTIEALWMGVPVVSLSDRAPVGRFGAAILGALGMEHWVARDVDGYVAKAVAAAGHPEALARTRAGLRARVERSPLRDARGLAAELESVYQRLLDEAASSRR
jgi:predicted O-linked N-acetylglucosamine transferase (SPINDLY family)